MEVAGVRCIAPKEYYRNVMKSTVSNPSERNYGKPQKQSLYAKCLMFYIVSVMALSCNWLNAATIIKWKVKSWEKEHYGPEITSAKLEIIRQPLRDFRLQFCSLKILNKRKEKGVCLVDVYGGPMGKGVYDKNKEEVSLSTDDTVRKVLDKAGFNRWKSGQPQIRLVGRNYIMQSSLGMSAGQPDKVDLQRFLDMPVRPGDMLVLAAVE